MNETKTENATQEPETTLKVSLTTFSRNKGEKLTAEERRALIKKLSACQKSTSYARYHAARKLRESTKLQRERAAKLASSVALTVGGTAAGGMVFALVAPSVPVLSVAGAVAGLIGGAWTAWISEHSHDEDEKLAKDRQ